MLRSLQVHVVSCIVSASFCSFILVEPLGGRLEAQANAGVARVIPFTILFVIPSVHLLRLLLRLLLLIIMLVMMRLDPEGVKAGMVHCLVMLNHLRLVFNNHRNVMSRCGRSMF